MSEKRKNYTLDFEKSRTLARAALDMSDDIGKNVTRQSILDALVGFLEDKAIYKKVVTALKTL